MTTTGERITYARVCIEVDAKDELISDFELEIEGPNHDV